MIQEVQPLSNTELDRIEAIVEAFEPGFQIMWSSIWPMGCCAVTSVLVAPLLRASLEIDFVVVCGWAAEHRVHAWIQSPAGDIIDPTYGQFDGDTALRIWSAGTNGGHEVHKTLTLNEEEEGRRSIKPKSTSDGSLPGSALKAVFNEMNDIDEANREAA